jgi:hypothetical protein
MCCLRQKNSKGLQNVILKQESIKEQESADSRFETADQHLPRHQQSPHFPTINYPLPVDVSYSLLQQAFVS